MLKNILLGRCACFAPQPIALDWTLDLTNKEEKISRHLQMFQKVEYGGGPIFKVVLEC